MGIKTKIMEPDIAEPIEWLLSGPSWVQYRTRRDLLGQPESNQEVIAARKSLLEDAQVKSLLDELSTWPGRALRRHNDASHSLHKLVFLADLGLLASDSVLKTVTEGILKHKSQEGAFQIVLNIPTHFGGSGEDEWQWMLCDAPSILYILLKFDLEDDPRVRTATNHLASLVRENGWPCAAASGLGKFRGPGRKDDPCPYANLVSLKALSQSAEWQESKACKIGAETLLSLWEQRKVRKPYLFGMGSDFAKLKAPLIWYDIVHILDVLSQFPWLRDDPRLQEIAALVKAKSDGQGRYTPESIWVAWKGWEFAQKKEASRWLTLLVHRALRRMDIA